MKLVAAILTCTLFCFSTVYGQTWQSINSDDISPINVFTSSGDGGTIASKWFKINPYDNSIWLGWTDKIQVLRNDGTIELFDYLSNPILHQYGNMLEFEFTSSYTYVVDENFGLYKYDGINWSAVYLVNGGSFISSDADSVWMSTLNNNNFVQSYDGFTYPDTQTFDRVVSKNGNKWVSGSSYDMGIGTYNNGLYRLYSPDTSNLLSWSNHDFKFAKNSDTLYVAGDIGFSLAFQNKFIDTITSENSSNMPAGEIIEFEFDNDNNIWAVFGNSSFNPSAIAFYDQISETWSQIYNSGNTPIDFSVRISIEVDTSGNLWVTDGQFLHILKINNPPAWLEVLETENLQSFNIYPNPVEDNLNIQCATSIDQIKISDLQGRLIKTIQLNSENYNLDLANFEAGQYIISIHSGNKIERKNFIKQ